MSRGKQLQEMEVGTKPSKTAVNANAKPADAMPSLSGSTPGQTGSWEDLGGPDPSNYRPDDDSAKLKTPGGTLKQVRDVVNKGATAADIVADPSAPDAFVQGIMEGKEWIWDGGILREKFAENTKRRINTLVDQKRLEEHKVELFNQFLNSL